MEGNRRVRWMLAAFILRHEPPQAPTVKTTADARPVFALRFDGASS
jgi:hypothetical protein